MHRVKCHGCKGRGHFRRDCPLSGQFALQYTESVADVEGALERLSFVECDDDDDPAKRRRRRKRRPTSAAPRSSKERENPHRSARFAGRYTASAVGAEARRLRCEPASAGATDARRRGAGEQRSARSHRARVGRASGTLLNTPLQPHSLVTPKGDSISKAVRANRDTNIDLRREPQYKHRSAGEPAL